MKPLEKISGRISALACGLAAVLALTAGCSTDYKFSMDPPVLPGGKMKAEPGSQLDLALHAGDRVFFANDSAELSHGAQLTASAAADWLKGHPNVKVIITGHYDKSETKTDLGARRARALKDYLVSKGVPASRLPTEDLDVQRPVASGIRPESVSQNRRAVIEVQ